MDNGPTKLIRWKRNQTSKNILQLPKLESTLICPNKVLRFLFVLLNPLALEFWEGRINSEPVMGFGNYLLLFHG